jgi:hypothetical protein
MRRISDSLAVRHPGRSRAWFPISLLCAISLFFALSLDPRRAAADPELSLSWSTKEPLPACPDRAWAMTRIESAIKRAPTADVSAGVHAIVAIEKRGSGYLLSLHSTVGTERGERTIEGADCHELGEAAILIIALSVSEADDARARNAEAAASVKREKERAAGARSPEPQRPAQAAPVGFFVRPEFVLELGLLKRRPTLGPELALGVEWGHYRIELAGSWLAGETSAKGREIALRLAAAQLRGCALFGAGRARGGPCVGLEFGDALGRNTESGVKNHTLWAASSLAARLAVALGLRLSLVLGAEMMASWGQLKLLGASEDRTRTTPVLASQWVQLRTHLGLEISF